VVRSKGSTAIRNDSIGAVSISGGTVDSSDGNAVASYGGTVTVSGTAMVTSTSSSENGLIGTIYLYGSEGSANTTQPKITGGTVTNYYGNGVAIYILRGTVSITGGTVSATSGYAVCNSYLAGKISISGGKVSAISGCALYCENSFATSITMSGTTKLTSANTDTEKGTIYLSHLISDPHTSTILEITGGTVENTSTTTGNAIRSDYHTVIVSITGGTVSKAGDGNYAVYKGGTGEITIGTGATIEGNKYGM
jgi:hypothetical protein